jgi:hypothetical protein
MGIVHLCAASSEGHVTVDRTGLWATSHARPAHDTDWVLENVAAIRVDVPSWMSPMKAKLGHHASIVINNHAEHRAKLINITAEGDK